MVTTIWERLQHIQLNKHALIGVAVCLCLLIGWWLDWPGTYLMIIIVLVGGWLSYWLFQRRGHRETLLSDSAKETLAEPTEPRSTQDDTADLPAIGADAPPPQVHAPKGGENGGKVNGKRPKERALRVDADGTTWLDVNRRTVTRRHIFSRGVERVTHNTIMLEDSHLVSKSLALRSSFEPIVGESKVRVFTRLHFMSHGPSQILLVLLAIALTVACVWAGFNDVLFNPMAWVIAWVVSSLLTTGVHLAVWIPWAYTVLIITDQRIILSYDPPLWLEGKPTQSQMISGLRPTTHKDQHGFVNWVLEHLHQTQYGIIISDTSADKGDEWLNQGIDYVPYPEDVNKIINELLMSATVLKQQRHEEDMELRHRQIEIAEETRDLLRNGGSTTS